MTPSRCALFLVLSAAVFLAAPAQAQQRPAPAQTVGPSMDQAAYLVRTTLMSIHDANQSENYTVLRDLAAPSMQARNSAADLAQQFLPLRSRKLDLFMAASLVPQLAQPPVMTANGQFRAVGTFVTRPQTVNFDFIYEAVSGEWRIAHIALSLGTPNTSR